MGQEMSPVDSLRTEAKFKKTEIGEIPVDWKIFKLGEIAHITMGQSPPSSSCFNYKKGLPFFQGKAEFGKKYPRILKWCQAPKKSAEKEDILISVRAPVGDINVAPEKSCIGRGLAAIRAVKSDNEYLYYVLNYFKKELAKIGQGSTFEAINKKDLFELAIPFPPLNEQISIAQILKAIDEAIDKKREIIEKSKKIKKGLMQELLTRGIGHTKFRKTEIGEIPVDWEVAKIENVCDVHGGSTPSTNNKEYWDGSISWAIPTDITKLKGNVINETEKRITEKGLASCGTKLLPVGSILLTSRATIGEAAINSVPMATNQGFANLVCHEKVHNWFLFYRLRLIKKELEGLASGSTFREISKRSIREIKIPLPSIKEQIKITEIMTIFDEEQEKQSSQKGILEKTKNGLMQELLSGKLRVI